MKPKKSFFIAMAKTARIFCEETTFHGLKNLSENARGLMSRDISKGQRIIKLISTVIWFVACLLGISFAVVLIYLVWTRFQSTPTITTIETNNYPIWNVPFPAVTLCNINKVFRPASNNLAQKLISRGLPEVQIEQFFSNLSKLIQPEYVEDTYKKTHEILVDLNYTTEKLMFELMQPCNVMLENCIWLGKNVPCDTIFRVAKSSEGFCCSFNYQSLKDNLEVSSENITVFDQLDDPIRRVSGAGQFVSLDLLLRVSTSNYVAYTRSYYGIIVLIHAPQDYPQASATTTVAQPGCDVILSVIPSVVVSEPTVRSLMLKQRNCYFEDEKKLRTTQKYSFQSCITECAVDTILKQCGCLPFYFSEIRRVTKYQDFLGFSSGTNCKNRSDVSGLFRTILGLVENPRKLFFNSANKSHKLTQLICKHKYFDGEDLSNFAGKTRQCSLQDVSCLRDNRHIMSSLQPPSVTNETLGMQCSGEGKNLSNYVTLKVHFKDVTCLKYRRDIFMTWDGFLASFGGIFGLCLGGSLISFIEIFYFFSLKLYTSFHEMLEDNVPAKEMPKDTEVKIFKITPFPADDVRKTVIRSRKQVTPNVVKLYAGIETISHDKYLD